MENEALRAIWAATRTAPERERGSQPIVSVSGRIYDPPHWSIVALFRSVEEKELFSTCLQAINWTQPKHQVKNCVCTKQPKRTLRHDWG
jgi:hypothetical protein